MPPFDYILVEGRDVPFGAFFIQVDHVAGAVVFRPAAKERLAQ